MPTKLGEMTLTFAITRKLNKQMNAYLIKTILYVMAIYRKACTLHCVHSIRISRIYNYFYRVLLST